MHVADNGPTSHQHGKVGEHVLFLGVPERIGKLPAVLMARTANNKAVKALSQARKHQARGGRTGRGVRKKTERTREHMFQCQWEERGSA